MINSNFFISLLLLLLNYSKTFCQSNNTTFLVSVKGFDYIKNNIRLCLNRSDIYPNGICFQEKVILKKNTSLSLNVSEPFYCYAELMIGDSVVASTNGFIVTNTTINILFDNKKKMETL